MTTGSETESVSGLPHRYTTLDLVWKSILNMISEGVTNRKHPFHTPAVSSVTGNRPEIRTVVLRAFDPGRLQIMIHSDYRTGKVSQLIENPDTSVLFYDSFAAVQLRLRGKSFVHYRDELALMRWQVSKPASRRCYLTTVVPGEAIPVPDSTIPPEYKNTTPDLIESDPGFENFCVIRTEVSDIDWLFLHKTGNLRALFKVEAGKLINSSWLAP